METPQGSHCGEGPCLTLEDTLTADVEDSPFEHMMHEEVRAKVERELREVPEPYRTTVLLRDIEGLAYEEIAEVLQVSLGTVKSRLTRGRDCLRKRLVPYVAECGEELGLGCESRPAPARRLAKSLDLERVGGRD